MHHPGYVFGVVDVVTAFFPRAKLPGPLFDIGVELVGVVEGGYHDVSALSSIRVIAVVLNDPAIDAVIIRVHLGHAGSIRAASDPIDFLLVLGSQFVGRNSQVKPGSRRANVESAICISTGP
jgi:hypothetical protein